MEEKSHIDFFVFTKRSVCCVHFCMWVRVKKRECCEKFSEVKTLVNAEVKHNIVLESNAPNSEYRYMAPAATSFTTSIECVALFQLF